MSRAGTLAPTFKGCKASHGVAERVLGILCPSQEVCPVMLPASTVCPKEPTELLDRVVSLTVRLWMVAQGQANCDPQPLTEGFPHPRYKLGATIGWDILREPKAPEHMLEQGFGYLESRWDKSKKRDDLPQPRQMCSPSIWAGPCWSPPLYETTACGISRGINFPAGICHETFDVENTEQDLTAAFTLAAILGHQYFRSRIERVWAIMQGDMSPFNYLIYHLGASPEQSPSQYLTWLEPPWEWGLGWARGCCIAQRRWIAVTRHQLFESERKWKRVKNSVQHACLGCRHLACCMYSRLQWSVSTMKRCRAPSSQLCHS